MGADRPDGDVAGTCSFQCSLSYCRVRSHLPTPWRETPTVLSLSRSAGWPRAAAWPTRSVRCGRGSILGVSAGPEGTWGAVGAAVAWTGWVASASPLRVAQARPAWR